MRKTRKEKIKELFLELASPEEREKIVIEDTRDLKKGIELLSKAIDAIESRRQEDSKNLIALIQHSIAEARGEITPLSEEFPTLKKAIAEIRDLHEKYKETFEDRSTKLSKNLRSDLEKKIDNVTTSLKSLNDTVYSHPWGGSTRTIYLTGSPISPENLYSDVNLIPGPGISITAVNNPQTLRVDVTISSTGSGGGGFTYGNEIPSGTMNGVNTLFTLAHVPVSPTLMQLFLNGALQYQNATGDYTISSSTITMAAAPVSGYGPLLAWYS